MSSNTRNFRFKAAQWWYRLDGEIAWMSWFIHDTIKTYRNGGMPLKRPSNFRWSLHFPFPLAMLLWLPFTACAAACTPTSCYSCDVVAKPWGCLMSADRPGWLAISSLCSSKQTPTNHHKWVTLVIPSQRSAKQKFQYYIRLYWYSYSISLKTVGFQLTPLQCPQAACLCLNWPCLGVFPLEQMHKYG